MKKTYQVIFIILIVSIVVILINKNFMSSEEKKLADFLENSERPTAGMFISLFINDTFDSRFRTSFPSLNSIDEINNFKQMKIIDSQSFIKRPIDHDKISFDVVAEYETDEYKLVRIALILSRNEKIVYAIPSFFMYPKNKDPPFPTIIGMHGHGNSDANYRRGKESFLIEPDSFDAIEFVKKGYLFFAADSPLFGERIFVSGNSLKTIEELTFQKLTLQDYNLMDFIIEENQIIMEYVNYLSETGLADKENIGCVGWSFGGFKCLWLSAFDERVKATVLSSSMIKYEYLIHASTGMKSPWIGFIPNLLNYINLEGLLTIVSPRKLMLTNGYDDPVFPVEGIEDTVEYIDAIYGVQGKPDNFKSVFYSGGHDIPDDVMDEIYKFLNNSLKN